MLQGVVKMEININLERTKSQLEWLKTKLYLDAISSNAQRRVIRRGQVYLCNLGVGVGSEMQKNRPCVVIQNDAANRTSPNTIVVPITHDDATLPCMVPITNVINGAGETILDGSANTACITNVSKARLGDCICVLSSADMRKIDESVAKSISLMHYYADIKGKLASRDAYIETIKSSRNSAEDKLKEIESLIESDNSESLIEKIKKVLETT